MLAVLVFAFNLPFSTFARSTAGPNQYLEANITAIDLTVTDLGGGLSIGTPSFALIIPSATPGSKLLIKFSAVYIDGLSPVNLSPQTASFGISTGTSRVDTLTNAPVASTGTPGVYTYNYTVPVNFPTGTLTLSILTGSLHDIQNHYGPPTDVTTDLSRVEIGAPPSFLSQYGVPIAIGVLLLIALLLLLARGRKRKKKT